MTSPTPNIEDRPVLPRDTSQATIVIGAGIAGLACARRLFEAGQPFLLISENVGGRICRSRDNSVNLGAYYVRADYHYVNRLVKRGRRINALRIRRHDQDGSYTLWNPRLFLHLPQAARFAAKLVTFRRHYEAFRRHCLFMSQAEALQSDPYLQHLYHQPAPEFIGDTRIGAIARHYLAPCLYGTTFRALDQLTAFSLLLGALPAIVPIYEFTFHPGSLLEGFRQRHLKDTVTAITPEGGGYRIDTGGNGPFFADSVVLATPIRVSQQLLGLPEIKRPVEVHSFEVSGSLRSEYESADINLFADGGPILAIARQADGTILLCSKLRKPDWARFFRSWEVVEHKHWSPAFHIDGDALLECRQSPNLYLIGDHNVCGLEDTYITGLYAANQLIHKRGRTTVSGSGR